MEELTLKQKLEIRIIELGTSEFVNPELFRSLSVMDVENKMVKILNGFDKLIRILSINMILLEFLIWIKNNMFNSEGKFVFKILKIIELFSQVKKLIQRIVEPDIDKVKFEKV